MLSLMTAGVEKHTAFCIKTLNDELRKLTVLYGYMLKVTAYVFVMLNILSKRRAPFLVIE